MKEPSSYQEEVNLEVIVSRSGDANKTSLVRVSTRDGSAVAGIDYMAYSQQISFKEGTCIVGLVKLIVLCLLTAVRNYAEIDLLSLFDLAFP